MLQYLFDTDHLTLLENAHPPLLAHMAAQPPGSVGISAISAEEALRGRLGHLSRPLSGAGLVRSYSLFMGTVRLVNQLPSVAFDTASETHYQQLRSQRLRVGSQDLKIAAVAIVNNLILLSRNQRDFSLVSGLRLADWSV